MKIHELINNFGKFQIIKIGQIVPPIPVKQVNNNQNLNQVSGYFDSNICYDQFENKYRYNEPNNTLTIRINELSDSFIRLLEYLSYYVDKIIIKENKLDEFNNLCKLLSTSKLKNQIIIDIADMSSISSSVVNIKPQIRRNTWMDFEMLPNNVYISNNGMENGEEKELQGQIGLDFNAWCLWLNDNDYECVINKLTDKTREKIDGERKIAKKFYDIYVNNYMKQNTDEEKVAFVYNWCLKNTRYDNSSINSDGTIKQDCHCAQDSVWTFVNGHGVCAGRARLFKTMLNNRYMRVECYLTSGMYGHLAHEWNEIYFNGQRKYYDLSFGICSVSELVESQSLHHNIMHEAAIQLIKK